MSLPSSRGDPVQCICLVNYFRALLYYYYIIIKFLTDYVLFCLLYNVSICTCVLGRSCALEGKFKSNNYASICLNPITMHLSIYQSIYLSIYYLWSGDSSVVERRSLGQKVAGRVPAGLLWGQLSVLTLISVSVTPPCYLSST